MKPLAFVLMPFGTITDANGISINFDAVYQDLIIPALIAAELTVMRLPQEQGLLNLNPEWLQTLLCADVVLAELSLNSLDIAYSLGIRHALRATGTILLKGIDKQQTTNPGSDYRFHYNLSNGAPNPATLANDIQALTVLAKLAKTAGLENPTSPLFIQIPQLAESDWNTVKVNNAWSFWQAHAEWEAKRLTAQQQGHIGDLLMLANESPVAQFRAETFIQASIALRKSKNIELALEYLEHALAILPNDLAGLQEKGVCLLKLAIQGKANQPLYAVRLHYITLLKDYPDDSRIWALLGDVDRDVWIKAWHKPNRTIEQMRTVAAEGESRLRSAIESYRQAFRRNPGHYTAGIQALTLMQVYQNLTGETRYFIEAKAMLGAVYFAAEYEPHPGYESKATLGDLEILTGTPHTVSSAYKAAISQPASDPVKLNNSLANLNLLKHLGFRQENVAAAITILESVLATVTNIETDWQPRQIILFSGHLPDSAERVTPRFPHDKTESAAAKIASALAALDANAEDLALTQGAAGGDMLFAEACIKRGIRVQLLQPFVEAEFIERSILSVPQGKSWLMRYQALTAQLLNPPRNMPESLGSFPETECNPFERCNRWLLSTALAYGQKKIHFICLWSGNNNDDHSGTTHMVQDVDKWPVPVIWINSAEL